MSHAVRLLEGDDAATCNQLRQILISIVDAPAGPRYHHHNP